MKKNWEGKIMLAPDTLFRHSVMKETMADKNIEKRAF